MSGDLRAQFESLAHDLVNDHRGIPYDVIRDIDAIVDLIPEGAVLVTEETLAEGLLDSDVLNGSYYEQPEQAAAAILRHLREGT